METVRGGKKCTNRHDWCSDILHPLSWQDGQSMLSKTFSTIKGTSRFIFGRSLRYKPRSEEHHSCLHFEHMKFNKKCCFNCSNSLSIIVSVRCMASWMDSCIGNWCTNGVSSLGVTDFGPWLTIRRWQILLKQQRSKVYWKCKCIAHVQDQNAAMELFWMHQLSGGYVHCQIDQLLGA